MIVATERNHHGMASSSKFSKVVPVTVKPVDFYAIDVQMSMPLSCDVILTRGFGSKRKCSITTFAFQPNIGSLRTVRVTVGI